MLVPMVRQAACFMQFYPCMRSSLSQSDSDFWLIEAVVERLLSQPLLKWISVNMTECWRKHVKKKATQVLHVH